MTAGSDDAEARASQEATDWLILLQDEPDDLDLRRRFDAWLGADPRHAAAWAATRQTAGMLAKLPPSHADQWAPFVAAKRAGEGDGASGRRASANPAAWPSAAGRARNRRLGSGLAAAAACLAVLVAPSVKLYLQADYATGAGQMRTVILADDSTVALAPDSAVSVAYSGGERRVSLLAGEAFFTVKHHPGRPFRVTAGNVETTDIGTAFDVRRGGDGATVAVQEGSVRVDDGTASPPVSEALTAGQSLRIAPTGRMIRGARPPSQVAAWRKNQLIAQDQPMREVVDQLRPYFGGTIILASTALADRPVTGVYNLADPVEALRGIAGAHGAIVRQITPWILLISGE